MTANCDIAPFLTKQINRLEGCRIANTHGLGISFYQYLPPQVATVADMKPIPVTLNSDLTVQ
jgi:hypothetical protein